MERLKVQSDEQAGFRTDRNAVQQRFTLRLIAEDQPIRQFIKSHINR